MGSGEQKRKLEIEKLVLSLARCDACSSAEGLSEKIPIFQGRLKPRCQFSQVGKPAHETGSPMLSSLVSLLPTPYSLLPIHSPLFR
ncbi:MAG: hypothetical protein V7K27_28860 [Nostoc sp.]|uniref:hypothetical protein n=1 Tax=Nostoc sp. TaxID=1180 RepID=UPI002FF5B759